MCKGVEWDGGEGTILQILNPSRRPPGSRMYTSALWWQDNQLPIQLVPMRSPVNPFACPFKDPTRLSGSILYFLHLQCYNCSSTPDTHTREHTTAPQTQKPHFKTFRKQHWATLSPHTVQPSSGTVVVHRHISINKVK